MEIERGGGEMSAPSTSSLSVITVASYRRKTWLLYLFLATLLYFWNLRVKVKLAIQVSHS